MTCNATPSIDKMLVAKRFSSARSTYDREASVQRQVAEKMMCLLTDTLSAMGISRTELPTHFSHVVEFGCGTGSYSRILLHTLQPETLLLNDLCPAMEECVKELCMATDSRQGEETSGEKEKECLSEEKISRKATEVCFLPGDAESLEFPKDTDLITSCSTLQWFNDPEAFFLRCHQSLATHGLLAFSSFGTTNLHEIRQLTGHGLNYLSVEELQALLSPGFYILHTEEEVISLPFPTPQAVLKHLKQTGVTGTEKRMWTRSRLQSFCEEYTTRFSDAAGNVSLTYHPIYIIARKKTK